MKRYYVNANSNNLKWEIIDIQNNLVVVAFPYNGMTLHRKYLLKNRCFELNLKDEDDKLYLKAIKDYVISGGV